ncbi:MAG: hypothetical protein ABEJ78_03845 [Haloferacaceae archaeon]
MSERDVPGREVAHRLFAAEFDDATVSYSESDEERAPKYVVTPSGARVNRLFAVGVLTEVDDVNEELLRARVVDPTGAFVTYAGQYQPDEMAFFDRAESPSFVALAGKARTFEPDDGDRIFTSVRPESVSTVDASTRDRWVVSAAEATLERVSAFDAALDVGLTGAELQSALREQGYGEALASGIPLAIEHYGTTRAYLDDLRRLAVDALEVVADERESVRALALAPGEGEATGVGPVPDTLAAESPVAATAETPTAETRTGTTESTASESTPAEPGDESTAGAPADSTSDDADSVPVDSGPTPTAESPTPEAATASPDEDDAGESVDADELGDFDAGGSAVGETADETTDEAASESTDDSSADESDVEEGMYELSEEERREVEENHDLGFESAADVGEPGEAGIDVPDADELAESVDAEVDDTPDSPVADAADTTDSPVADAGDTTDVDEPLASSSTDEELVTESDDAPEAGDGPADTTETAGDGPADTTTDDLESVVVEAMDDLDDGDGADRETVVAAVVEEYGVDVDDAEDAIESALMSGKCYEPNEDRLKAI